MGAPMSETGDLHEQPKEQSEFDQLKAEITWLECQAHELCLAADAFRYVLHSIRGKGAADLDVVTEALETADYLSGKVFTMAEQVEGRFLDMPTPKRKKGDGIVGVQVTRNV